MRVTLLGTGCPVAHPARGGAATLVELAGSAAVLFDCGSGASQALVRAGCPGARLDALVVTHLHSDHLVDFYQLVVSSWHQGRDRPWRVLCPAPVVPVLRAVMAAWEEERRLRIEWERRPSVTGLEVGFEVLEPDVPVQVGGLEILPVLVDHAPVEPAFGFVLGNGEHRAVISGDTAVCPRLVQAGQGADLLVHEVFVHREMPPILGRRSAETVERVARYHTGSSEVGGVAARMGARALALTHFVPPEFDRAALLAEVAESYDGPIFIGEDGMRFDLATGQVAHGPVRLRIP